ncbi:MAG: SAM-dependent DNA methyltransferase [Rhizobiales bacterium]|nr:SAM-dependent DNA methyltransferase [Hyphomicrobiales bacterium]
MSETQSEYASFLNGNATKSYEKYKTDFIKTFNQLARHRGRYEVFSDFITLSAISLNNAMFKNQQLEDEYLSIGKKYSTEDFQGVTELFTIVTMALELKPFDVLGDLFMSLELGNKHNGQFFTPHHISELMAKLVHGDSLKTIDKPFITLTDPACGAGSMILAYVELLQDNGHNPAQKLYVQAVDIDRTVALMCFIQLTLWDVPAEVIVGNTLTMEYREYWYTFAFKRCGWRSKLAEYYRAEEDLETANMAMSLTEERPIKQPRPIKPVSKAFQLDLF